MAERQAVLWDLDGTVLDPAGSIRATIEHVLAEEGLPGFDPETERLVGMPLRDILRLRTRDEALVERMTARYREHFAAHTWRRVRPVPGVLDVVAAAREAGPNAVVTTKGEEEADGLLRRMGLRERFDAVVGDDDRRPLKPHPAPIQEACRRLGTRPEACAMVGDTHFDMEAARAAGAWAVGVLWGHGERARLEAAGARRVAATPLELGRLLDAWSQRGAGHRGARV